MDDEQGTRNMKTAIAAYAAFNRRDWNAATAAVNEERACRTRAGYRPAPEPDRKCPVFRSATKQDLILLAPFVDVGRSWNSHALTPDPETLASIGLGLILNNILPGTRLEVYWGQPLNHVTTPGGNLQDEGVHVQVVWQVF